MSAEVLGVIAVFLFLWALAMWAAAYWWPK